jgi:RNA polymerase sigma-70 factor (ECF subfamily)
MVTDRELIEKVKHGESEAYGQLFQKYYGQIYAICLSMLKNPQDAEELAQDVFILGYVRLDQLREPGKFFSWLKRIARNQSKNHLQKAGPRLVPLDLASSHKAPDAPDERILRQELMDAIIEAIQALPTKDREVVQARIDGLSYREISDRSGVSVEASMNRLSRARRRLADSMRGILSAIASLPKLLSPKRIISVGIAATEIGTASKITIGVAGIVVAGFIGLQLGTRLIDSHSSETEISQASSSRTETSQKSIQGVNSQTVVNDWEVKTFSSEDEEEIQEFLAWLDSLETKTVEVSPTLVNSNEKILPGDSKGQQKMEYHEIYDTLVHVAKDILLVKKQMEPLEEELKRLANEWRHNVRDPENLTEEKERMTLEIKEYSRPTLEELKELDGRIDYLANSLINEITMAAPGAVRRESKDTPKGTLNYIRIDYEHTRSVLGPLPDEYDAFMVEFFLSFANYSK